MRDWRQLGYMAYKGCIWLPTKPYTLQSVNLDLFPRYAIYLWKMIFSYPTSIWRVTRRIFTKTFDVKNYSPGFNTMRRYPYIRPVRAVCTSSAYRPLDVSVQCEHAYDGRMNGWRTALCMYMYCHYRAYMCCAVKTAKVAKLALQDVNWHNTSRGPSVIGNFIKIFGMRKPECIESRIGYWLLD